MLPSFDCRSSERLPCGLPMPFLPPVSQLLLLGPQLGDFLQLHSKCHTHTPWTGWCSHWVLLDKDLTWMVFLPPETSLFFHVECLGSWQLPNTEKPRHLSDSFGSCVCPDSFSGPWKMSLHPVLSRDRLCATYRVPSRDRFPSGTLLGVSLLLDVLQAGAEEDQFVL